jgi:predicted metal-dependent HD superfamily phosphohydrolase
MTVTLVSKALEQRWQMLAGLYAADHDLLNDQYRQIKMAYSKPERHYHNLAHLQQMFLLADAHHADIKDPDTVTFAIFFHDVVYKPRQEDNEVQSALLAKTFLDQTSFPNAAKVVRFIEATRNHENPWNDPDLDYLLDFDLAILGAPEDQYWAYTRAIRKEYRLVPDLIYKPGRKKVLQRYIHRPSVFQTEAMREQFEDQAQHNILMELAALSLAE